MTYYERLQNVTIIGAAGKMGSGITLLTAVEIADVSLMPENKGKKFVLNALDLNKDALAGLLGYLEAQVTRLAGKKMAALKAVYTNITDEAEITSQYVKDVLSVVNPVSEMSAAKDSTMIFEAAVENPDIKVKIFKELETINSLKPWYFTNTSSIPIHTLNDNAGLEGRIVGFHFYNPPAVQKLVELIGADKTLPELVEFASMFAKRLRKVVIFSNDIAAFIGNGHFTRDILHAATEVELLATAISLPEAIYTMNKVSQEYLVRPMGIFQLCDYVGIDVCSKILKVMASYIKDEDFSCSLLDSMIEANVIGGQNSDGTQKDGILKYEKGRPVAIFDFNEKAYVAISDFKEQADARLGEKPKSAVKWKDAISSPEKDVLLKAHFGEIKTMENLGAQLAIQYGNKAVQIGKNLVKAGVANNAADVNTVMMTGFFHAYGPINELF
jgi:3-hydroxyacyl-CoA dehydrogenase